MTPFVKPLDLYKTYGTGMKITTWRRMTVTSSLNEISTEKLHREVVRGEALASSPQRVLNDA